MYGDIELKLTEDTAQEYKKIINGAERELTGELGKILIEIKRLTIAYQFEEEPIEKKRVIILYAADLNRLMNNLNKAYLSLTTILSAMVGESKLPHTRGRKGRAVLKFEYIAQLIRDANSITDTIAMLKQTLPAAKDIPELSPIASRIESFINRLHKILLLPVQKLLSESVDKLRQECNCRVNL